MPEAKNVKYHGYDCKEFNITVTMKENWIPHFLAMLKRMEYLGNIGSSRDVTLFSDGDGNFRPKFVFDPSLPHDALPMNDRNGDHYYDTG